MGMDKFTYKTHKVGRVVGCDAADRLDGGPESIGVSIDKGSTGPCHRTIQMGAHRVLTVDGHNSNSRALSGPWPPPGSQSTSGQEVPVGARKGLQELFWK
jgi:hypothetical protein